MLGSAPLFRGTVTPTSQNTHVSPPSLLPRALGIPAHTAEGSAVFPQGHCLVLVSHPSTPILTSNRGHQSTQPLVLFLQGSADFPHVLQALGAKEKRPKGSIATSTGAFPSPQPLHLCPQVLYLFNAGLCTLGGSQSVLGCFIWKHSKGKCLLAFSNQQGPISSISSSCGKI